MANSKLRVRTHNRAGHVHHFFVSSAAEWRVGYDVATLIADFKRRGYPFNVHYVPGSVEANYEIVCYAPQVEGAVWLGFYGSAK